MLAFVLYPEDTSRSPANEYVDKDESLEAAA